MHSSFQSVACAALAMISTLIGAGPAGAQQQVTLQSGTVIVGDVSMDGEDLVITVDGAELRTPFKDVARVNPASEETLVPTQRLLLKGLEAMLLSGDEKATGLLAEAYHQTPEDVNVAFWYARSLARSGYGSAAKEVFDKQRVEILSAYPGTGDALAGLIEDRIELESLPLPLIRRIDQIREAATRQRALSDKDPYAAYFQIVDQEGEPVNSSSFRVMASGDDEDLEAFADGYYLFTCGRHRSYTNTECKIQTNDTGVKQEQFEFHPVRNGVADAGTFRVYRFVEKDQRPLEIRVRDGSGNPVAHVNIRARPTPFAGNSSDLPSASTNEEGLATLHLFPGNYHCSTNEPGYLPVSNQVQISPAQEGATSVELKLQRLIDAAAKLAWLSEVIQTRRPGDENAVVQGDTEVRTDGSGRGVSQAAHAAWVQMRQTDDELEIFFVNNANLGRVSGKEAWVGRLRTGADANDAAEKVEDRFRKIDLARIGDLKEKAEIIRPAAQSVQQTFTAKSVEAGTIIVGQVYSHIPQTGGYALTSFKLLVTDVTKPAEGE